MCPANQQNPHLAAALFDLGPDLLKVARALKHAEVERLRFRNKGLFSLLVLLQSSLRRKNGSRRDTTGTSRSRGAATTHWLDGTVKVVQ